MPITLGKTYRILRPALWSGCVGEAVKVVETVDKKKKLTLYRIKIASKYPGEFFHTDVPEELLEEYSLVWEIEPVMV